MSPRQLIVLAVAFIAAIGALVVIRGMNASPPDREEVAAPIEGQQVLVVTRDVQQGASVNAGDLAWRLFPNASVGQQFVRQSQSPDATTELQGAVALRNFTSGEPVTEGALILPGDRSMFSALVAPGYRAVSIEVDPESAAGGFIQPNDRVDVMSTVKVDVNGADGSEEQARSAVVLADVRVISIGGSVSRPAGAEAPEATSESVAVLELSPQDARILEAADAQGAISLALRGVAADTADLRVPSAAPGGASQGAGAGGGVLIHAFGRVGGR